MNPLHTYFPIFPAKRGEFNALSHLQVEDLKHLMPIFEIPVGDWDKTSKELFIDKKVTALTNLVKKTEISSLAIDTYYYSITDQILENSRHVYEYAYQSLKQQKINLIPVIGYDRWFNSIDSTYRTTISKMEFDNAPYFIIRLDGEALDDCDEPDYFLEQIEHIFHGLKTNAENCLLLVDLKSVVKKSLPDLIGMTERITEILSSLNPLSIVISGSSIPETIDKAVDEPDSCGLWLRKESLIWQNLTTVFPQISFKYSDYGVKAPSGKESVPAGDNANGKIRYTTENHYYIARGHKIGIDHNFSQMHILATKIANSSYFEDDPYSWADNEIKKASNRERTSGNHETWITIDTNRHIQHVLEEINHKIFV
ncbi:MULTISPECIES: beta family protein [unclassified Acinetobacter]|uniref:beta family protein n=1 Tax=unclassified Acinetobacter TaxID=196816 RepID=UPI0015D2869F|nr:MULTISPECIES: beta family protein [unclassified Acinetobacter]UUS64993.1 beta family protein [Acinetobacter sp. YH12068_T]